MVKAVAVAALLACGGCSLITDSFATNDFSGDPFPINVDTRSGGILVGLRAQNIDRTAVLDILSPLTLFDPGITAEPTVNNDTVTLLGDAEGVVGLPDLPRARFDEQQIVHLHPCSIQQRVCTVGLPGSEAGFDAILGNDALAGDALRLRLGDDQVFVLADIGGSDSDRTDACDGVFPSPYRGGGTLVIAGTELAFAGRRVTLEACLSPVPDENLAQVERGTDALFVASTSIAPSLLSDSAYRRYREIRPTSPPVSTLPETTLALPSGPIRGRLVTIDKLALVARSTTQRAPCRQFYGHNLMIEHNCIPGVDLDCPCENGDVFCATPATVEIAPAAGIEMLVVADDEVTLQALRTEFRPTLQEIDGILGTGAMRDVELDIDYPNGRVLARCSSDRCVTRPALNEVSNRRLVRRCLGLP